MTQVFKLDTNGCLIGVEHVPDTDAIDFDYTLIHPPTDKQGFYKHKWIDGEWIEGKTEDEFLEDEFLQSLQPTQKEVAKAERELETIELILEMGLI